MDSTIGQIQRRKVFSSHPITNAATFSVSYLFRKYKAHRRYFGCALSGITSWYMSNFHSTVPMNEEHPNQALNTLKFSLVFREFFLKTHTSAIRLKSTVGRRSASTFIFVRQYRIKDGLTTAMLNVVTADYAGTGLATVRLQVQIP